MGPRKKSKPNPEAGDESQDPSISVAAKVKSPVSPAGGPIPKLSTLKNVEVASSPQNPEFSSPAESRRTWYGGTWPRTPKATPVTQVAKESISAASAVTSEAISAAQRRVSPCRAHSLWSSSVYLPKGNKDSSKSPPTVATTTKINITSNNPQTDGSYIKILQGDPFSDYVDDEHARAQARSVSDHGNNARSHDGTDEGNAKRPSAELLNSEDKRANPRRNQVNTGWIGWFSRSANTTEGVSDTTREQVSKEEQHSGRLTTVESTAQASQTEDGGQPPERHRSTGNSPIAVHEPAPRSWFGIWGASQGTSPVSSKQGSNQTLLKHIETPKSVSRDELQDGSNVDVQWRSSDRFHETLKPSGWAFWTRDPSRVDLTGETRGAGNGELQTAGSAFQQRPETSEANQKAVESTGEKLQRPQSPATSGRNTSGATQQGVETRNLAKTEIGTSLDTTEKAEVEAGKPKQRLTNLILPLLESSYGPVEKQSILQQFGRLLQPSRPTDKAKHVNLKDPPRLKRALAIGVHGYFPSHVLRSFLGQPTGTSIRFANGAATAIERFTSERGYFCQIEKVALEGEGKIAERLSLLWKLLLDWIEDLRKADYVMFACHSQGVPVAIMLISKLISFGCLQGTRVGVCAMAGINLGPFGDYKSRWISGSAGELFDFAQSSSEVSRDYAAALDVSLRFGVRISYIGSIDDQLVSLESSTFGTLVHPLVYRAVFVDGRLHAPDFLSHLVGFALKLRNLGVTDHGLIRELSAPLAGSLYGGEGHSRIYDDDAVYSLALRYSLESSSVVDVPPQFLTGESPSPPNPYILPFAMRGLLEEEFVKSKLQGETIELLQQFDRWRPSSRVLKDVKFRLEGVRSKL